ncbi:MCE family protein [Mycobacterium sp. 663a-19]|uniref:MCE family protein n=1 Tax=Mycobacterium sp. 663a-19 TaxID=2986148 RepID=UPI002D1E63EA|nr:MCE family protein [Mycobacterium sp. 663a-19]MEB3980056.1 MCE family protein [Mycobacterium sp. 663a-19]
MLKYRGTKLFNAGFIGVVVVVLVTVVALQYQRIMSLATAVRYQALFSEAGGLTAGNDVTVLGIKVGTVSGVSLRNGDALVTFTINSEVVLGSGTTAHIRTGTPLGGRVLTLESAGGGRLHSLDVIPVSRTSSPYSLSEAVSEFTTNVAATDTDALNQSLDKLSETIDAIAPQLGPTFDELTRLSRSLNGRNQTLGELLKSVSDVTGILSERSQQVNALVLDANDLLGVLVARRQAIVDLLANTSAVAKQVSGLVHDNEAKLAPTLDKLNSVTEVLEKNRDNITKALPGLAKFAVTLGDVVASGNFYSVFVGNLLQLQTTQPFLDYIFGFRRGANAGQPPDNAGPRAEFPFPVNGIPQPGDRPWFDRPGGQP